MSFFKAQVSFPSNVASIFSTIKHNSPIPFLAQALYSLFKRSPLKCNFLKCLSTWVKIFQIPYVSFDLATQFLFKFFTIPHCHDTKVPCKYEAHTFSALDKRMPSRSQLRKKSRSQFGEFQVLW